MPDKLKMARLAAICTNMEEVFDIDKYGTAPLAVVAPAPGKKKGKKAKKETKYKKP